MGGGFPFHRYQAAVVDYLATERPIEDVHRFMVARSAHRELTMRQVGQALMRWEHEGVLRRVRRGVYRSTETRASTAAAASPSVALAMVEAPPEPDAPPPRLFDASFGPNGVTISYADFHRLLAIVAAYAEEA